MDASHRSSSRQSTLSTGSEGSSNYLNLNIPKRQPLPVFTSQSNLSNSSLLRPPAPQHSATDNGHRRPSAFTPSGPDPRGHRRQFSQGYFEPSMPSTSLTQSQIAAQTAFQHLNLGPQHVRRTSSTVALDEDRGRRGSYDSNSEHSISPAPETPQYKNGLIGNKAAATAATAVWKAPEPEKEKIGGLRRFKAKHIAIMGGKEKEKPLPSPIKPSSGLANMVNASTTSLAESTASSVYKLPNNSVTTILPADEKKKTGLRQKLKLRDKDDHQLSLSSASSNSRPVDINNPQSLYSFAPSSPQANSFVKSVSGLNLRHGARVLRSERKAEKEREELRLEQVYSKGESDTSEWPSLSTSYSDHAAATTPHSKEMQNTLLQFGLSNNTNPDDVWEFLKARLLAIFGGERVQIAVEDLNRLVIIHVQKCVLRRDPSIIVGDLENLLQTGFTSLSHTLRGTREEGLISALVDMWLTVLTNILPFIQAVFLPLDQEFKGRGTVLKTPIQAAEFWGALPSPESIGRLSSSPSSVLDDSQPVAAGEELEVRRILLTSFRDNVILPRFDILRSTFSRLSLDSVNATLARLEESGRARGNSLLSNLSSSHSDPRISSSYSSQTSTLLGSSSAVTPHFPSSRSRAASGVSAAPSSSSASDVAFQSFFSPAPVRGTTDLTTTAVTETVSRMLQCLSILCSVQSNDDAQTRMEDLTKELKLNWLGRRGRAAGNRKGFVGSRVRTGQEYRPQSGIRSIASTIRERARDGSPTPTPTRQGTIVDRARYVAVDVAG